MTRFLAIALIAVGFAATSLPAAVVTAVPAAACNYRSDFAQNCGHAFRDWMGRNVGHQSSSYQDVEHRTETFRGTLRECWNCATHRFESRIDQTVSGSQRDR